MRVVPTTSLQAGLAALVAFDPSLGATRTPARWRRRQTSSRRAPSRSPRATCRSNGLDVRKGAWLGLAEGEPVAGGTAFDEVVRAVVERLLAEPRGILTLLTGEEVPALDALLAELAVSHPDLELEVHEGGQPHYPLLLAAE